LTSLPHGFEFISKIPEKGPEITELGNIGKLSHAPARICALRRDEFLFSFASEFCNIPELGGNL